MSKGQGALEIQARSPDADLEVPLNSPNPLNPPCPRCDCARVNRIAQERITKRWVLQDSGSTSPSMPAREIDYLYICEGCNHSWKEAQPK